MKYCSTKDSTRRYSPAEVCLLGLAPDGGLFIPEAFPVVPQELLHFPERFELAEIAAAAAAPFLTPDISAAEVREITGQVLSFDIPLRQIEGQLFSLELFHGPTAAFKDFGALFLARVLSRLWKNEARELTILVATSGDTGGAVAHGFFGVPGVRVVILYPKGRVSELQEKQMTTLGGNVHALEVEGSFDDCQRLVKTAFADTELRRTVPMTSANSINFARLLPQTFYYIEGVRALRKLLGHSAMRPIVFSVPSGNLGNLCAGVIAKRLGLPIDHFLLATNRNRTAVDYLSEGTFAPRVSERTLSNAMDVGNPSNLERLIALYESHAAMTAEITGSSWSEEETRDAIRRVDRKAGYVLDPHGAVGYLALEEYLHLRPDAAGIVLETAHPAKFPEAVEQEIGRRVPQSPQLEKLTGRPKRATAVPNDYGAVRDFVSSL